MACLWQICVISGFSDILSYVKVSMSLYKVDIGDSSHHKPKVFGYLRAAPCERIALSLCNLCNLQLATLVKLTKAFHFKVAIKFINTPMKFRNEIVGVLRLLVGYQGEHVRQ